MNDPAKSRLYGRRKGRPLRVRKSYLMETLLPRIKIDLSADQHLDPTALFDSKPTEIWLEIGFGGGEHLAAQAKLHPGIGFIGCEPFVNGVASLLDHLDREQLKNVRIYPNDARVLIDALPDRSIARCFVLFADPWPKKRHADRRFICPDSLSRVARVMKKNAELRLASDDARLIPWTRGCMSAAKDFVLQSDSATPPPDWINTRYEQKAISAGRKPFYFSYRRV